MHADQPMNQACRSSRVLLCTHSNRHAQAGQTHTRSTTPRNHTPRIPSPQLGSMWNFQVCANPEPIIQRPHNAHRTVGTHVEPRAKPRAKPCPTSCKLSGCQPTYPTPNAPGSAVDTDSLTSQYGAMPVCLNHVKGSASNSSTPPLPTTAPLPYHPWGTPHNLSRNSSNASISTCHATDPFKPHMPQRKGCKTRNPNNPSQASCQAVYS